MNKQKTIVYANTIDWDFHGLTQRPHHFFKLLSEKNYKIYFVNKTQRIDKVRDRISENLEVYHNWEVFKKRVPKVDVYFSSWANRYVDLVEIDSDLVVYDSLDSFPDHESNELNMINKSDIVLAASNPLHVLRSRQHENVHLCKNACFSEHGEIDYEIPSDLLQFKNSNKPIILFSGALSGTWCDIPLVEKIASEYTLIVVGRPWNIPHMPKGVYYLGEKSHDELQAYYAHCDVNILPFMRGQIADYSSPIKLFEAMAHGKPSVATDIPEALAYPDAILSSRNHNEFIKNIKEAIKLSKSTDFSDKVKSIARENTWNDRVNLIDELIQNFFQQEDKG